MKKVGRFIYRLAMALCVFILMMTQYRCLGSDPFYPCLAAILLGYCAVGAFFEMEG